MMTAAQTEKGRLARHSPLYSQDGTMTFLGCEHEATLLEALRAVAAADPNDLRRYDIDLEDLQEKARAAIRLAEGGK